MAFTRITKVILKSLSFNQVNVKSTRALANLKKINPFRIFYKKKNFSIHNGTHDIAMRIYYPSHKKIKDKKVLLFFHGGGWSTDSIDSYETTCANLAKVSKHFVIAVDYRLAPEYKFPIGLEDCYVATKTVFEYFSSDDITLIGDSAGGNLVAAISLLANQRKEFKPKRQILIYPALGSDYSSTSPFPSVQENGEDYILTRGKLNDYISFYASKEEDKVNPLFAPIYAKDVSNQPDTLIITAEFDPLRDEGELYARRLKEANNNVEIHRMENAVHGYFALGIKGSLVKETFRLIIEFLKSKENM